MSVHILDHPLLQHKLTILRDKNTGTRDFRATVSEIAMLMCYEATRDLAMQPVDVETPVGTAHCKCIAGKKMAVVPILRAGLGMVDGILNLSVALCTVKIVRHQQPDSIENGKFEI